MPTSSCGYVLDFRDKVTTPPPNARRWWVVGWVSGHVVECLVPVGGGLGICVGTTGLSYIPALLWHSPTCHYSSRLYFALFPLLIPVTLKMGTHQIS